MLLNPPYLSVMTEGGSRTRSEKRFLVDSLFHLMYGGLLIYIIPYYRLTPDICRVLCDNFDDVTVWRFCETEFNRFKQVAVMGIRKKRCDGSNQVQPLASLALEPDKLPELSNLPEKVVMSANAHKVLSDRDVFVSLARHKSGDWGEVSKADWKMNDYSVKTGMRVVSAYTGNDGDRFWIITEADRSYTTILLPGDY